MLSFILRSDKRVVGVFALGYFILFDARLRMCRIPVGGESNFYLLPSVREDSGRDETPVSFHHNKNRSTIKSLPLGPKTNFE